MWREYAEAMAWIMLDHGSTNPWLPVMFHGANLVRFCNNHRNVSMSKIRGSRHVKGGFRVKRTMT